MPGHEQHCEDCKKKLEESFSKVHSWLDECYDGDGSIDHRDIRHHLEAVEEVRERWGDEAAHAAIFHIMLDWELESEKLIPKNQQEAEFFRNAWLANRPRLDDSGNDS